MINVYRGAFIFIEAEIFMANNNNNKKHTT